jgi:hypothetical protein
MVLHLKIVGVLLLVLSLAHVVFPKRFDWKNDLKNLQLINRQLMHVHTFFVALVVFLMGLLCLTSAKELVETNLGQTVAFGLWVFWTLRLIFQFFVYAPELWRGKQFETAVHVVFSLLWIYFSVVFLGVWRPELAVF